jgi:hypothetical protein
MSVLVVVSAVPVSKMGASNEKLETIISSPGSNPVGFGTAFGSPAFRRIQNNMNPDLTGNNEQVKQLRDKRWWWGLYGLYGWPYYGGYYGLYGYPYWG